MNPNKKEVSDITQWVKAVEFVPWTPPGIGDADQAPVVLGLDPQATIETDWSVTYDFLL